MAKPARYLWGVTKVRYIDFTPSTAPPGKAGRMYFCSTLNTFKFCEDGTSFKILRDVFHN